MSLILAKIPKLYLPIYSIGQTQRGPSDEGSRHPKEQFESELHAQLIPIQYSRLFISKGGFCLTKRETSDQHKDDFICKQVP